MNLAPAASRKLWDILSACIIRDSAHPDTEARQAWLKQQAHRSVGQTKKVLLKLAALDDTKFQTWSATFINWMNDKAQGGIQ